MTDLDELRADCTRCAAWCCVATGFRRSADFAFDRPAGVACRNLQDDFGCRIHATLRPDGMKGCTSFDCFGAGQKLTRSTLGGRNWRDDPAAASDMFAAFHAMRDLHELLWYLTVAREFPRCAALWPKLDASAARIQESTRQPSGILGSLDTLALNSQIASLLDAVSELVRTEQGRPPGRDLSRQDLAGKDLRRTPLRRARLRGAVLIAADVRAVDLRCADLLGADVRDTRFEGADLSEALFLNQTQVNSARGNLRTQLPPWLTRPGHWV